ncbi:MAG: S41 family peptidase [Ruminococcus sp.]|nr:S41 family peptidase [Ruminococcus sp.]MDE7098138.1 S41 family peptidase [Ruminococcus sp.]
MNKKISLGLALSLIAVSVAVTFILTSFFSLQSFNEKVVDVNEKAKKYTALQSLDNYVRENYFGEIDESVLNNGILKGYVAGVNDKYSRYLTEEEYITEKNDNSGNLVGLGLTLAQDESGYIRISEIITNSPAYDSGIQEDDIITFVDGMDVKEIGFAEAADAMKGTEGSEISLTIRRNGKDTEYKFTRRSIELKTVEAQMMSNYIGYIKITGFKQNTPEQFMNALEGLTVNGAVALIFDLRDNTGGLVSALEECLDPLLPEGIIAVADYKDGSSETLVYSDEEELMLPMVVIVNENTASAAELFAASLRDFNKAPLVGSQTYGKGVIQSTTELDDGGALVLTIAEYRTAPSQCFNGIGITPDVQIENDEEDVDSQFNKAVEVLMAIATDEQ